MIAGFVDGYRKVICMFLAGVIFVAPVLSQQIESECLQARLDGKKDGGDAASPLWLLAGVGCGCLGVGAAYVAAPSPPAEKLVGKSADYVICYTEAYKKEGRTRQALYAVGGWLVFIVVYIAAGGLTVEEE